MNHLYYTKYHSVWLGGKMCNALKTLGLCQMDVIGGWLVKSLVIVELSEKHYEMGPS